MLDTPYQPAYTRNQNLLEDATMMLRTLGLLMMLALVLLAARLAAAPLPGNVKRIGFLSPFSPSNRDADVLLHALRQLDWVEGQNLAIEDRWADGRYEQLPHLAAELVRLPVQVLVTISTPAARTAKQATTTLPICGQDPERRQARRPACGDAYEV
jgi:putative ABC transport system substrate-binding protein